MAATQDKTYYGVWAILNLLGCTIFGAWLGWVLGMVTGIFFPMIRSIVGDKSEPH